MRLLFLALFLAYLLGTGPARADLPVPIAPSPAPAPAQTPEITAPPSVATPTVAGPAFDLASLNTNAIIGTPDDPRHFASVVPTIEPDAHQAGIYWLRLHYYAFQPGEADAKAIASGSTASMDKRVAALDLGEQPKATATMNLALGPDFSLRQFNVSIPTRKGCAMTGVVPVEVFKIQGNRAILKIHGGYPCDISSDGSYFMDVNLDAQVFRAK